MATPASFWKKYGSMIPPDQNPYQTVTFSEFGARVSRVDWYRPKLDNFAFVHQNFVNFVHISIHSKMGLIAKDDLFGEIWVNFQEFAPEFNQRTYGVVYGRLP